MPQLWYVRKRTRTTVVLTPHSANIGDSGGALRRHHVSEPPPTNLGLQEPRRVGARSDRSNQICECTCRNQGHDHLVSLIYRVGPESVAKAGSGRPFKDRKAAAAEKPMRRNMGTPSQKPSACARWCIIPPKSVPMCPPACRAYRLGLVESRLARTIDRETRTFVTERVGNFGVKDR